METIHVKSIDPISQELLKAAYQRGIKLNWERYEKLQPQDGFLRVGLSCPYGCLQGPCRIDPFGRGPDRGFCGLDRDRMVAALLLRLALSGALEAMPGQPSEPSFTPQLRDLISLAVKNLGGDWISYAEVMRSASYLSRPMESPEILVLQAIRLALLTLGWLEGKTGGESGPQPIPLRVGYGLLARKEINVGVCGQPSPGFLKAFQEEMNRVFPHRGQLVSLGSWVSFDGGFLPCLCTSGEAELLMTSGRINLLIAGPGTDPSMLELAPSLNVPIFLSPNSKSPGEMVQQVQTLPSDFTPAASLVEEGRVAATARELEESFRKETSGKLAMLGGSDHPYHSLGWIPTEAALALRGQGYGVAGWGDAALWMIKKGLASPQSQPPVHILDEKQGPLGAAKAVAAAGRLKDLRGVCFTGMKSCQDLALALGLACLGIRVSTAIPLPLWGSEKVRILLQAKLASQGGSLTHFDHPARAEEILEWFVK